MPDPTRPSVAADFFGIRGKSALVTGGAQGIGLATARLLAELGADVTIADREESPGRDAASPIGARFAAVDVTSSEEVDAAVEQIVDRHGRLDIAVNCAGIKYGSPGAELDDEAWARAFDINTAGVMRVSRAAGRAMLASGGGAIVNIASISGTVVNVPQWQAGYNASKAAVILLTKSLAVEWAARGVRVNSVSPGYVETAFTELSRSKPERMAIWLERTPMHRIARADEIANAVLFLASDLSSFVTGADLVVDGGYTAA